MTSGRRYVLATVEIEPHGEHCVGDNSSCPRLLETTAIEPRCGIDDARLRRGFAPDGGGFIRFRIMRSPRCLAHDKPAIEPHG